MSLNFTERVWSKWITYYRLRMNSKAKFWSRLSGVCGEIELPTIVTDSNRFNSSSASEFRHTRFFYVDSMSTVTLTLQIGYFCALWHYFYNRRWDYNFNSEKLSFKRVKNMQYFIPFLHIDEKFKLLYQMIWGYE